MSADIATLAPIGIVLATSLWVLIDASSLKVRPRPDGGFFNLGPVGWFLSCLLLWIVAFPGYLAKRPQYALQRRSPTAAQFEAAHRPQSAVGGSQPLDIQPQLPPSRIGPFFAGLLVGAGAVIAVSLLVNSAAHERDFVGAELAALIQPELNATIAATNPGVTADVQCPTEFRNVRDGDELQCLVRLSDGSTIVAVITMQNTRTGEFIWRT